MGAQWIFSHVMVITLLENIKYPNFRGTRAHMLTKLDSSLDSHDVKPMISYYNF